MAKKGELTPKQQKFVAEYIIDSNATQAAIRAGYSKKTAYRTGCDNLSKPQIMQALTKALKKQELRTEITADYVLAKLKMNAEQCLKIHAETGKPVDAGAANKALELLGKTKKMFVDKLEMDAMIGAYERNLKELD
ncbi:MAG: terminase small subunit [Candidatus Makaraimicrobium thalassicum]|nr:MAG: terminase small subunit [Candidatus Omnitrophota bacterium]